MREEPLVSIVVVSFNSSDFIIETLESIKNQSYNNIELIICDDCSVDNSVDLCRVWAENNSTRFRRLILHVNDINKGIAGNLNIGIKKCDGEWIKGIAADDLLLKNCIEDNISYAKKTNALVIQSTMLIYMDTIKDSNYLGCQNLKESILYKYPKNVTKQYNALLLECLVSAPSVFIKRDVFDVVGYYDESILLEDWPMWLSITKKGIYIDYLDTATCIYRQHINSMSAKQQQFLLTKYDFGRYDFLKKYVIPNTNTLHSFLLRYKIVLECLLKKMFNNNKNLCSIISFRVVNIFLKSYIKIRKKAF